MIVIKGTVQAKYILRLNEFNRKRYHVDIIRGVLTRNIAVKFADVRDEIVTAFGDKIPLASGEVSYN